MLAIERLHKAIWVPQLNENIIGERALIKSCLIINYKDLRASDPRMRGIVMNVNRARSITLTV